MNGVFPNGPGWDCHRCNATYAEDYEPMRCEACGGGLTRVLASFEIPTTSHEPAHGGLNGAP